MKPEPIIKEITVNAPLAKVWKAITDKEDMKNWYFPVEEFKVQPGYQFKFYGEREGRKYPISCKITAVQPKRKLSYTWSYDDFPAETVVSYELFEIAGRTKIKLTHEGLEKIPPHHPEASKESHIEGWNFIIGRSLKEFVEKEEVKV